MLGAELDRFGERLHNGWRLVNKNTPLIVNDKNTFLKVWPTFHGRFKDSEIEQITEIKSIDKLAEDTYLVVHYEITKKPNKTSQRPISTIIKRDKEDKRLLVYHVHE